MGTHLAHRGLLDGETSAAISTGVNFMMVPDTSTNLAALGALSANGRSKTFDASADGYGRGEGCLAVVMRLGGTGDAAYCQAVVLGMTRSLDRLKDLSLIYHHGLLPEVCLVEVMINPYLGKARWDIPDRDKQTKAMFCSDKASKLPSIMCYMVVLPICSRTNK